MSTTTKRRLDARTCLCGEPRLSDAQVIALRAAAAGTLRRVRRGWTSSDQVVSCPTIESLVTRHGAIRFISTGPAGLTAQTTERGRKLLAAIDDAARTGDDA